MEELVVLLEAIIFRLDMLSESLLELIGSSRAFMPVLYWALSLLTVHVFLGVYDWVHWRIESRRDD